MRLSGTARAYLLLEHESEAIMRKTIEQAKQGNMAARRLCLDHLLTLRRRLRFKLPELNSAADAKRAMADIAAAVAIGDLTPAEAADLSRMVNTFLKALKESKNELASSVGSERRGMVITIRGGVPPRPPKWQDDYDEKKHELAMPQSTHELAKTDRDPW
jgi:hypothetical protein